MKNLFFWRKATYEEVPEDWQGRCMNAERLLHAERESHAVAQQELSNVQENLKNCMDHLEKQQAEMENLKARNADLEEEVARLKHKKLPTREKV